MGKGFMSLLRERYLDLLGALFICGALSISPVLSAEEIANPPKVKTWCEQITPRLPKITLKNCQRSQLKTSNARSVKGLSLMVRDFAGEAGHKAPLRVLLIGGIHGDEQSAAAIVFKWMDILQKSGAPEFRWKVAPVLNPDGLLAEKPTRVNANGVDLNRNFPTPNWNPEALRYWEKKTKSDPRRYPGKTPISEPESRWVFETIRSYQPNVIISVHAPFGVLDLDGSAKPPQRFGRLIFSRVGVYPGSLGNYSGVHQDIPVLTIELPSATRLPADAEVNRIWQDMQIWIRKNVVARKA